MNATPVIRGIFTIWLANCISSGATILVEAKKVNGESSEGLSR